jgi:hypothetical protein
METCRSLVSSELNPNTRPGPPEAPTANSSSPVKTLSDAMEKPIHKGVQRGPAPDLA